MNYIHIGRTPNDPQWRLLRCELPEEDQNCLVWCEDTDTDIPHKGYFRDGFFYSLETGFSYPLMVTHWMPLPKVPQGD